MNCVHSFSSNKSLQLIIITNENIDFFGTNVSSAYEAEYEDEDSHISHANSNSENKQQEQRTR